MKKLQKKDGITLIVLIITIIIMLILAGVSLNMILGDNGLITKAREAKIVTAIGTLKEVVQSEELKMDEKGATNSTVEELLTEGKVQRIVKQDGDNYYMYYVIVSGAYDGMQNLGKGTITSLKDVFLIDDDFNIKYIDSNGNEYGDNLNLKLLEDETKISFSSKSFSEYVSKISGVTEEDLKFKWMKNQTSLSITDSSIDSLVDLVFFPNLTTITLGGWNGIKLPNLKSLDGIEKCSQLKEIYMIGYNGVEDYSALGKLNNLSYLYCSGSSGTRNDFNKMVNALKSCNNIKSIVLSNMNINDISEISNLTNLTSLSLKSNKIEEIEGLSSLSNLTSLNLSGNKIEKIEGLNSLSNLTSLDLSSNKIETIENLGNLSNLKTLNLGSNKIEIIEGLDSLSNLSTLYLDSNQIEDITPLVTNSTSLTYLSLKNNTNIKGKRSEYTTEELEKIDEIGEILDKSNGTILLSIEQLGLFTGYKTLDLSSQGLTTLELLEGQTELTSLDLRNNQITLEDEKSQEILKSMTKLQSLDLGLNGISNLKPINSLINLTSLDISNCDENCNLKDIQNIVSQLTNLICSNNIFKTIVNCDKEKITKIYIRLNQVYTELPDLSGMIYLKNFVIREGNKIEDFSTIESISTLESLELWYCTNLHGNMINFSNLTELNYLDMRGSYLSSEDLENLKSLKNNKNLEIHLENNSIIDASALLELDTSCKIYLSNNVNLTQESKDALKARFGNNVSF
jgi:Leucine-rich repeat (LRR) protein